MPTARPKRVTMQQVANKAGVALSTASLVLGGKSEEQRIAKETVERVQQAARELQYSPNLLVQSLQRGRTNVLSFFNGYRKHRDPSDLYFARLTSAIERAAGERGYDVLTHCAFHHAPEDIYHAFNGGQLDGILLFAPVIDDPLLPLLHTTQVPVVLINTADPANILHSVRDDMVAGMESVARILWEKGHRQIAIIVDDINGQRDIQQRVVLLREAMARRGAIIPDNYIVVSSLEGLEAKMANLLRISQPPTALFCCTDSVAYATLDALQHLGIAVPQQVSLIGYDGIVWPHSSEQVITSIMVDLEQIGQESVRLLDRLIEGEIITQPNHLVPIQIYEGTTLAPPPYKK
jgi:LacI family transcriptional regulator